MQRAFDPVDRQAAQIALAEIIDVSAALRMSRLLALIDRDETLALLVTQALIELVERGRTTSTAFSIASTRERMAASRPVGVLGISPGQACCKMSTAFTDAAFSAFNRSCWFSLGWTWSAIFWIEKSVSPLACPLPEPPPERPGPAPTSKSKQGRHSSSAEAEGSNARAAK